MILDATCALANICYPQDISLLNKTREKLETIIYRFCKSYGLALLRRYSKIARKNYFAFAKSKMHSAKQIRKALRKQMGYIVRDIRYLDEFMSDGYAMLSKEIKQYRTIIKLYEQQKYMYGNKVHSVENRIISLRPIGRGKVKVAIGFGAKFNLSLDGEGYGHIKKISFESYNETTCLIEAIERFMERTDYYLERILADWIYRTRENRNFCKEHGICLSGPKLGRTNINAEVDKKQKYQDDTDRIEVERTFSLSKRCYGIDCITTKLEETQLTSIALSVFVMNLCMIQK